MRQHILHLLHEGHQVTVLAGYDLQLRKLYLHVLRDAASPQNEVSLYDSLAEPGLDWSDINVVNDKLTALGIQAPASLIKGIFCDLRQNVGDRVAGHCA